VTTYVIYTSDGRGGVIYITAASKIHTGWLTGATKSRTDALEFPTAREAYEWAGERKLDTWHVGVR
jgi:hypothetical protein